MNNNVEIVWIMDVFNRDFIGQIGKFNMDRWAVCDCGDADKHGKFIEGVPKDHSSDTHKGIYFKYPEDRTQLVG